MNFKKIIGNFYLFIKILLLIIFIVGTLGFGVSVLPSDDDLDYESEGYYKWRCRVENEKAI